MLELLKGIDILDPKFYIPVLVGIVVVILVARLAKKLVKFVLFIAVIALVLLVYFNLPSVKLDGSAAVLTVKGQEYRINPKDSKIDKETVDGKDRVYLISDGGKTRIELPFSADFARRFILGKINEAIENEIADKNK